MIIIQFIKKSRLRKYKAIINSLYKELKVGDLIKLRLLIDEIEESKLSFFKTFLKCVQSYNDIDAIIPCWGWNGMSCKKGSCEYCIHKSIDCCQTEDTVNYCLSCFIRLKSLSYDDNTIPVNDVIFQPASIDDDVMTKFNSDG